MYDVDDMKIDEKIGLVKDKLDGLDPALEKVETGVKYAKAGLDILESMEKRYAVANAFKESDTGQAAGWRRMVNSDPNFWLPITIFDNFSTKFISKSSFLFEIKFYFSARNNISNFVLGSALADAAAPMTDKAKDMAVDVIKESEQGKAALSMKERLEQTAEAMKEEIQNATAEEHADDFHNAVQSGKVEEALDKVENIKKSLKKYDFAPYGRKITLFSHKIIVKTIKCDLGPRGR